MRSKPLLFVLLLMVASLYLGGCNKPNDPTNFSKASNILAKSITQLNKQPGITLVGYSSRPEKRLLKIGLSIDHSKITNQQLKEMITSYFDNVTTPYQPNLEILIKPYELQIEEIDKNNNTTSLIAQKLPGSAEVTWKED